MPDVRFLVDLAQAGNVVSEGTPCLDCNGTGIYLNPTTTVDEVLGCLTCRGTGEAPAVTTEGTPVKPGEPTTFYVTFGQKYRHEMHPTCEVAHPDGYVEVVAWNEMRARALVIHHLGAKWSHMYTDEPDLATFPRGAIARITEHGMDCWHHD
jgi:hypothetical protein